ncbi:YbaN family protein [Halotalea alkalilenta]|uniref:Inner membrane protein n=1 Tax=Halotalea alkalilenta TaxID=376489 RepID=A0A172YG75_9GAMM|nr:YbaN family protein [Halotalea alkalilenta]ANF58281.1 hypothetical protein A5892_13045 [Halotalea alkalilenta]
MGGKPGSEPEDQPIGVDAPRPRRSRSRWARTMWVGLAVLCFAIGVVGIFLPLLPATDFFLLAAICASRGSRRLERWIRANRFSGPAIEAWERERAISPLAKCLTVVMMSSSLVIIYLHTGFNLVFWAVLAVLVAVAAFVLSRPSPSRDQRGDAN